jgi:amino acid transporter
MSGSNNSGKIGLLAAATIGINAMIGVGIITIPAALALYVGPAGVLSYIIAILVVLALGIALGRVAFLYPGNGWTYLYPSKWAGHKVGIFSAISYLIGILIAMGFLIQQAGIWVHLFIPSISPTTLGLLIIFILMVLVLAGAEASAIGQYVIGVCVTVPLLLTGIFCWFNIDASNLTPFFSHGYMAVIKETPKALFSLLGFESIVSLYAVVKEPSKNVPRAFVIAILFVGFLYLFFTAGLLFSVNSKFFIGGMNETLAEVLRRAFPSHQILSTAVIIGAMFGIIGTLHSMLWSASELFTETLNRTKSDFIHGLLDKGIWNKRVSIILSTVIMVISSFLFQAEVLISLTDVLLILPSGLAIIALFFLPKEWRSGCNLITIVAMCGSIIILYFAGKHFLQTLINLFA